MLPSFSRRAFRLLVILRFWLVVVLPLDNAIFLFDFGNVEVADFLQHNAFKPATSSFNSP